VDAREAANLISTLINSMGALYLDARAGRSPDPENAGECIRLVEEFQEWLRDFGPDQRPMTNLQPTPEIHRHLDELATRLRSVATGGDAELEESIAAFLRELGVDITVLV
jgi:hypothetical protein